MDSEITVVGAGIVGSALACLLSKQGIKVNLVDIPQELIGGEYSEDEDYRDDVKNWLYDIWEKKDEFLSTR